MNVKKTKSSKKIVLKITMSMTLLEYYLIPMEYLIDPYLLGMPPDLSQEDLIYHLPPPPIFCHSRSVVGVPGLYHSHVGFGVSKHEADKGSCMFSGQTLQGDSY